LFFCEFPAFEHNTFIREFWNEVVITSHVSWLQLGTMSFSYLPKIRRCACTRAYYFSGLFLGNWKTFPAGPERLRASSFAMQSSHIETPDSSMQRNTVPGIGKMSWQNRHVGFSFKELLGCFANFSRQGVQIVTRFDLPQKRHSSF
jgi:hypothetical protein